MWVIASLPFWATGAAFSLGALCGFAELARGEEDEQTFPATILLLGLAGGSFLIAAKVASV